MTFVDVMVIVWYNSIKETNTRTNNKEFKPHCFHCHFTNIDIELEHNKLATDADAISCVYFSFPTKIFSCLTFKCLFVFSLLSLSRLQPKWKRKLNIMTIGMYFTYNQSTVNMHDYAITITYFFIKHNRMVCARCVFRLLSSVSQWKVECEIEIKYRVLKFVVVGMHLM